MNDISNSIKVLEKLAEIESNPTREFTNCGPYFRKIAEKIEKENEGQNGMYRNNEKRIILKHTNFLVYLADEKDRDEVLQEIDNSGEYNGEDVFISPQNSKTEWLAKKKNNEWILEEKSKPVFFT